VPVPEPDLVTKRQSPTGFVYVYGHGHAYDWVFHT
jgi:hypothetical protein